MYYAVILQVEHNLACQWEQRIEQIPMLQKTSIGREVV